MVVGGIGDCEGECKRDGEVGESGGSEGRGGEGGGCCGEDARGESLESGTGPVR